MDEQINSVRETESNSPSMEVTVTDTRSKATDAPKIDSGQLSLKIIINKTHVGPYPYSKKRLESLSKAAGKIKINNDLKITLKSSDAESSKEDLDSKSNQLDKDDLIYTFKLPEGKEAEYALLLMMAWDKEFPGAGTPAYLHRYNEFTNSKIALYQSWGFNYVPASKQKPPVLTESQKSVYNQTLSPLSFDYWEVRLSFKQPGHKSYRSTVYRLVQRNVPDKATIARKLVERVKSLQKTISISPK